MMQLAGLSPLSRSPDWHLLPVIEGPLTQLNSQNEPERLLRLIGVDLMSVANLPSFVDQGFDFGEGTDNWYDWLGPSERIWISHQLAEEAILKVGDQMTATVSGRAHTLTVTGILGSDANPVPSDLVIADLPTVQSVLARAGELDRIEVLINDREQRRSDEGLAAFESLIRAQIPNGLELAPAAQRVAERAGMTAAFRLNLTILSLIAILVGAYLILQALDTAVVRRRAELATLKSLGVSAPMLFTTLMLESLLIGVLGSILGLGLGVLLAAGTVHGLADTVNALYFTTAVDSIQLSREDVFIGMSIGIVFSLIAGWFPARDAMETPPAQILSRGDWSPGFDWIRRPWLGLCLLVLGALVLLLPPIPFGLGARLPLGGFLAAGFWVVGGAFLSGQILVGLSRIAVRCFHGLIPRLAFSRLAEGSSRHRLAVAGLVVAVAMVTGMLQMVGSFRGTIEDWFDVRFQADLYVSERGAQGASTLNGIDPEIMAALEAQPSIDFADTLYTIYVEGPSGRTVLGGVDFGGWQDRIRQIWIEAPGNLQAVESAEPALVSETFARRFDLLEGGKIILETPSGPRAVSPVGIYADYGNEFGAAVIDEAVWKEWSQTERPINTSLYLSEGTSINAVRDALRLKYPGLDIRNARELRKLALGIFEQTFKVTTALNAIGLTVAVAGLVLSLFSIFTESSGTWNTLRHLGMPSTGYAMAAGLEGAGIALTAWISGSAIGLFLGWILIFVINVQSFGWTLVWHLPITAFFLLGAALVTLGGLSGAVTGIWWQAKQR